MNLGSLSLVPGMGFMTEVASVTWNMPSRLRATYVHDCVQGPAGKTILQQRACLQGWCKVLLGLFLRATRYSVWCGLGDLSLWRAFLTLNVNSQRRGEHAVLS